MQLHGALFKPMFKKFKKSGRKKFPIFQEMQLSCSNIKKFLVFCEEKAFLIFPEPETPEKFVIILEKKFFIFQEMKILKNILYFTK